MAAIINYIKNIFDLSYLTPVPKNHNVAVQGSSGDIKKVLVSDITDIAVAEAKTYTDTKLITLIPKGDLSANFSSSAISGLSNYWLYYVTVNDIYDNDLVVLFKRGLIYWYNGSWVVLYEEPEGVGNLGFTSYRGELSDDFDGSTFDYGWFYKIVKNDIIDTNTSISYKKGLIWSDGIDEISYLQQEENYTNADPCTTSIGAITAGMTFSNKTPSEMLTSILYSYQLPAFTMLTIDSQNAIIEVGDVITANPLFLWTTSNPTNITVNSLSIKNITDNVTLATGIANDGTEQITATAIQLVTNISKIFRIQATNTNSAIFYRYFTVSGQYRLYYGESTDATLIESTIKTLRANLLTSQIQNTFVMYGGGYKYICYESTLGTLTSFKDAATNLNVPFETSYLVALTNTFGITKNYRVHRTTNILGSDINIIAN